MFLSTSNNERTPFFFFQFGSPGFGYFENGVITRGFATRLYEKTARASCK
jgi:hypothetical protein